MSPETRTIAEAIAIVGIGLENIVEIVWGEDSACCGSDVDLQTIGDIISRAQTALDVIERETSLIFDRPRIGLDGLDERLDRQSLILEQIAAAINTMAANIGRLADAGEK